VRVLQSYPKLWPNPTYEECSFILNFSSYFPGRCRRGAVAYTNIFDGMGYTKQLHGYTIYLFKYIQILFLYFIHFYIHISTKKYTKGPGWAIHNVFMNYLTVIYTKSNDNVYIITDYSFLNYKLPILWCISKYINNY